MSLVKQLREHLKEFSTEAQDEIHKFIDHLEQKFAEPAPAVVAPPSPIGEAVPEPTFVAPTPAPVEQPVETENVTDSDTPVSADPAPVVDAPVVTEEAPAEPVSEVQPEEKS